MKTCSTLKKSSTSGSKTNTRNGSVMPLKTYLIACHSWGFSMTPKGWISKSVCRRLFLTILFCPLQCPRYCLAGMLPHWLVRLKTHILRPTLMVHQQPQTRDIVLSVNTRQRHSIGWSMLKLAMLFMIPGLLTRHSKPSTMCSQVTRYLHWLNIASTDQHLSSPCSVVSGWLGAQGYQYREYHCCGEQWVHSWTCEWSWICQGDEQWECEFGSENGTFWRSR